MRRNAKTRTAIASPAAEVKGRRLRNRKKIKLVEDVKEEVKDVEVARNEDEVESNASVNETGNETLVESDDENRSESAEDDDADEVDSNDADEVRSDDADDSEIQSGTDDEEEQGSDSDDTEDEEEVARKKRKKSKYNAEEEARLERLVFGNADDIINKMLKPDDSQNMKNLARTTKADEDLEDSDRSSDSDLESEPEDTKTDDFGVNDKSAWVDEDDMQYSVDAALKQQNRKLPGGRTEKVYTELLENKFTQIVGTPKWASLDVAVKDEDEDSDNEILKHTTHLVAAKAKKLRQGTIDIKALTSINKTTHTEGPEVSSVQFHPTSTVALVAGDSGVMSLFQIDGKENNKLHSICFEKFPINCARFLKDGTEVVMGSRYSRSLSQAYDLMSGKTYKIPLPNGVTNMQKFEVSPDGKWIAVVGRMGQIHLLSGATKELVASFKMNKKCITLAFSPDSEKLFSHGDTEEMYIWDLKSRRCLHKAVDDGCIASSAIAISPSGQFVATGSKQGVVNVYDMESVLFQRTPAPLKIILNLVTPITRLKFNPTSEILAMSSSLKENAFKMMHIPSFTVFANFPTFQTKMFNPLDIDFSPSSGYLGLSNNKGSAYLYRLKHYGNY